jgi:diacylglycerol kinase (ATP)
VVPLLLNPAAGRALRRRVRRGLDRLDGVVVDLVRNPDEMVEKVRRVAASGADRVLVAGGDGTLHHAIRGLEGTACALGLVPLGSGNDLARALDVPRDPVAAARRALTALPRRIDLAEMHGRKYAGVAGIGFDSDVVRFVSARLRRARGPWIYPYAVLRTALAFTPPHVTLEFDGGAFEGRVTLVAAANSPYFGGGMMIAPRARLDDGLLDLVVVERLAPLRLLSLFHRVYRGTHTAHPSVHAYRTRRVRVTADRTADVHADGEHLGHCGARASWIEALPGELWVAA